MNSESQPLITTNDAIGQQVEISRQCLRPRVLGKGGVTELEQYLGTDMVSGYELFTTYADLNSQTVSGRRLRQLAGEHPGVIEGLHMVMKIPDPEHPETMKQTDLSHPGRFGDDTQVTIERGLDLAQELKSHYFNIHLSNMELVDDPGFKSLLDQPETADAELVEYYHEYMNHRFEVVQQRVSRLAESARERGITLVLEADAHSVLTPFGHQFLNNLTTLEQLVKTLPEDVKIMLDEEHLYRAALYNHLLDQNEANLALNIRTANDQAGVNRIEMTQRLKRLVDTDPDLLSTVIKPYVEKFIAIAGKRLFGAHVCGWDYTKEAADLPADMVPTGLSMHDAHLPPRRVVKQHVDSTGLDDVKLQDRIDHRHTLMKLKNTLIPEEFNRLLFVIEYGRHLSNTRGYDLVSQGATPVIQSNQTEFAIAHRSLEHLVSQVMNGQFELNPII